MQNPQNVKNKQRIKDLIKSFDQQQQIQSPYICSSAPYHNASLPRRPKPACPVNKPPVKKSISLGTNGEQQKREYPSYNGNARRQRTQQNLERSISPTDQEIISLDRKNSDSFPQSTGQNDRYNNISPAEKAASRPINRPDKPQKPKKPSSRQSSGESCQQIQQSGDKIIIKPNIEYLSKLPSRPIETALGPTKQRRTSSAENFVDLSKNSQLQGEEDRNLYRPVARVQSDRQYQEQHDYNLINKNQTHKGLYYKDESTRIDQYYEDDLKYPNSTYPGRDPNKSNTILNLSELDLCSSIEKRLAEITVSGDHNRFPPADLPKIKVPSPPVHLDTNNHSKLSNNNLLMDNQAMQNPQIEHSQGDQHQQSNLQKIDSASNMRNSDTMQSSLGNLTRNMALDDLSRFDMLDTIPLDMAKSRTYPDTDHNNNSLGQNILSGSDNGMPNNILHQPENVSSGQQQTSNQHFYGHYGQSGSHTEYQISKDVRTGDSPQVINQNSVSKFGKENEDNEHLPHPESNYLLNAHSDYFNRQQEINPEREQSNTTRQNIGRSNRFHPDPSAPSNHIPNKNPQKLPSVSQNQDQNHKLGYRDVKSLPSLGEQNASIHRQMIFSSDDLTVSKDPKNIQGHLANVDHLAGKKSVAFVDTEVTTTKENSSIDNLPTPSQNLETQDDNDNGSLAMDIDNFRSEPPKKKARGILKDLGHKIDNHPLTVEPYHDIDPSQFICSSKVNAVLTDADRQAFKEMTYLGALFEMNGIEPEEDVGTEEIEHYHKPTKLRFSNEPLRVKLTYAFEDYERRGEGIDPLAATAQYELEKRIEKMDTFKVDFTKGENEPLGIVIIGMGVGADAGMEKLGIFIKIIQENSAAYATNKLRIGDMLVEIDEINLVGVTQSFATSSLHNTKSKVSFLIAREKPGHVSEIQDLIKQSLEMDRLEQERQRHVNNVMAESGSYSDVFENNNSQRVHHDKHSPISDDEEDMYGEVHSHKSDDMTDMINSRDRRNRIKDHKRAEPRNQQNDKNPKTIPEERSNNRDRQSRGNRDQRDYRDHQDAERDFEMEQDNKLMIEMAVAEEAQKLIVLHEAELKLKNDRIKELEKKVTFEQQFSAQVKIELDRHISQLNISRKKIVELERTNLDLSNKIRQLTMDSAYESSQNNSANGQNQGLPQDRQARPRSEVSSGIYSNNSGKLREGMSSHHQKNRNPRDDPRETAERKRAGAGTPNRVLQSTNLASSRDNSIRHKNASLPNHSESVNQIGQRISNYNRNNNNNASTNNSSHTGGLTREQPLYGSSGAAVSNRHIPRNVKSGASSTITSTTSINSSMVGSGSPQRNPIGHGSSPRMNLNNGRYGQTAGSSHSQIIEMESSRDRSIGRELNLERERAHQNSPTKSTSTREDRLGRSNNSNSTLPSYTQHTRTSVNRAISPTSLASKQAAVMESVNRLLDQDGGINTKRRRRRVRGIANSTPTGLN